MTGYASFPASLRAGACNNAGASAEYRDPGYPGAEETAGALDALSFTAKCTDGPRAGGAGPAHAAVCGGEAARAWSPLEGDLQGALSIVLLDPHHSPAGRPFMCADLAKPVLRSGARPRAAQHRPGRESSLWCRSCSCVCPHARPTWVRHACVWTREWNRVATTHGMGIYYLRPSFPLIL